MSIFRKKRYLALLGIAVVAIGGLAFAYWTGGGSGTGSGSVGTSNAVVLTGTVSPGSSPGTSKPVSFTAANSGTATYVTEVQLVSVAADGAHSACVVADFTMANVAQGHLVPAGATVEPLPNNGSLAFANTGLNQDACKNATLTLTLSST